MSTFKPNLQRDPECPNRSLPSIVPKPIFKNAIVEFAPPYPDYPKSKFKRSLGSPNDPSSASAKSPDSNIDVVLYFSGANVDSKPQESAWDFLQNNTSVIESNLRRKLFSYHTKSLTKFLDEYLPDSKVIQRYWKQIEGDVPIHEAIAIDRLFKLVRIGIADTGLDECGFCSYEFQTGWDHDHGLSVMMHKSHVLAAGAMEELICAPEHILSAVQNVQGYDFDEGDYRVGAC
ncbi:MAG: hypothetical protein SFV81_29825 [Pirellulaceae bacterium]|nr:hypothetical protein [Pirellulaceae bacterium]